MKKTDENVKRKGLNRTPLSLHTYVKVCLARDDVFFGPGKARLLRYIEETGSLQEACTEMGLSYSKGSRMIKRAEELLGYKLLERWTGGDGGGGSRLTRKAEDLLEKYEELVLQIEADADKAFAEVFQVSRKRDRYM